MPNGTDKERHPAPPYITFHSPIFHPISSINQVREIEC